MLFNYLGLPLGINMRKIANWNPIIEKFKKKLQSWKSKFLSTADRVTLIRSVLSSLPLYFLSLFKIPAAVAKQIVKLQRDFFWNGSSDRHKLCLVAWSKISKPKDLGGLGIESVHAKNQSLLFKWYWKYINSTGTDCFSFIKNKCAVPSSSLMPSFNLTKSSTIWKNIVLSSSSISVSSAPLGKEITIKISNGKKISFWKDVWCPLGMLKAEFHRIFQNSLLQDASLAEIHSRFLSTPVDEWPWRRKLYTSEQENCLRILIELRNLSLSSVSPDCFSWNPDPIKGYHVKSGDVLHQRGILQENESKCPFCSQCTETPSHLFLHCKPSWLLWQRVCNWWGVTWVMPASCSLWYSLWPSAVGNRFKKSSWLIIGSAVLWSIWLMRNDLIFNKIHNGTCFLILHSLEPPGG